MQRPDALPHDQVVVGQEHGDGRVSTSARAPVVTSGLLFAAVAGAEIARRAARSTWSAGATASLHWVTARTVEVRRPPSRKARSPCSEPGPYSARRSPSTSTRTTPSSTKNSSCPGLALLGDRGPAGHLADSWLGRAVHELDRQLALECRLDLGGQSRGVAGRPTGCACRRRCGTKWKSR